MAPVLKQVEGFRQKFHNNYSDSVLQFHTILKLKHTMNIFGGL